MGAIFLSAKRFQFLGEADYYKDCKPPFLIQYAVRETRPIAVIRECRIIWGGHPAITPMVLGRFCRDMGVDARDRVTLYQKPLLRRAVSLRRNKEIREHRTR